MTSSIFTQNTISAINNLVETDLFGDIIEFDIADYSEFDEAVESADNGRTDFELDLEVDQVTDDPDVTEQVMTRFFEGYYFGRGYDYFVKLMMKLDKDANALEVIAYLALAGWGGGSSNGDEFVVYDGGTQLLEDYVEDNLEEWEDEAGREIDYEDARERAREQFTDADQFNPDSTLVSTIISLED